MASTASGRIGCLRPNRGRSPRTSCAYRHQRNEPARGQAVRRRGGRGWVAKRTRVAYRHRCARPDRQFASMSDHELYVWSFADVYDTWYGEIDDPAVLVEAILRRRRPPATLVEFGGGTGRLARPLSRGGFTTISLDVSSTMLAKTGVGPLVLACDMTSFAPAPTRPTSSSSPTTHSSISPTTRNRCGACGRRPDLAAGRAFGDRGFHRTRAAQPGLVRNHDQASSDRT